MKVTVALFAGLRERAGAREVTLELADGARVADALAQLTEITAGSPVVMAVNREYAAAEQPLHPGDELALIPPVSGGDPRAELVRARVTDGPLSLDELVAFVADPRAGAIVTFHGVTREVDHLDYEAYTEMALAEIQRVCAEAVARHGLCAAAASHRTGRVALGEPSVLVAASAPHRGEAFAGAREVIDEIKRLAPIWKREAGEWVAGSLPTTDRPGSA